MVKSKITDIAKIKDVYEKYLPESTRRKQAINGINDILKSHAYTTVAIERAADALRHAQPATRKTIEDGLYHFAEAAKQENQQMQSIMEIYEVEIDEDNK